MVSSTAAIAGPTTTPRSCTVCNSALAAPSRVSPTSRGSIAIAAGLVRPCCGRQGGQRDHDLDRPVRGDDSAEREHQREPKQVPGDQHGPPAVAVGDRPADRPQQHVGQQAEDRRGTDPPGRASGHVHIAQQRCVVEPIADLRCCACPDQCAGLANLEHVVVCATSPHRVDPECCGFRCVAS